MGIWLGFATIKVILGNMAIPGILDRFLARKSYEGQLTGEPKMPDQNDNLRPARVTRPPTRAA
jgi:hypothetical protein